MTADEFEKEALSLRPALTAMAARWLGGTDCAENLVQDAMLKLWAMCAELRSPMAPLARVLVHNLCIDYLRRHHYTLSIDTTDVPDLSNASADIERIERMMAIVGTLPPAPYRRHVDGRHSKAYGRNRSCGAQGTEQGPNDRERAVFA